MDYFNEDTFCCHEYLGHKLFWYCNKCLSGKEYPNDNQISFKSYNEIAIEILAFLLKEENFKIYLKFDSYTYLKIITKYFLEPNLLKLIHDIKNKELSFSVKFILEKYLGKESFNSFKEEYILNSIRNMLYLRMLFQILFM